MLNMIKKIIVGLCLACCLTCASQESKIMSYNIRNCKGMDKIIDYNRVIDVINAEAPDVIMLQEVDSATVRSAGVVVCDSLAGACGYVATYAPAIAFGGGKYGIAVLTRDLPLSVTQRALPGREELRTIVAVECEDYIVACTHLSLTAEDRMLSLPIIIDMAQHCNKPFIIAGDFNAEPDEAFIAELSKHFTIVGDLDTPTFPAHEPNVKIDYIAIYNNTAGSKVKAHDYKVIAEPIASDHRPIVATVSY